MKFSRFVLFVSAALIPLFVLSCSNNTTGTTGSYPSADFLATNNSVYRHTVVIIDSLGMKIEDIVDTVYVTVSVETKNIQGFDRSLRVQSRSTPFMMDGTHYPGYTSVNWYVNSNDSIYSIAYITSGDLFLPKNAGHAGGMFDGDLTVPYILKRYGRKTEQSTDSLYLSVPKRTIYILPLYSGKQWSGYPPDHWFKQIRKIEGAENVSTAAGTFSCYKMRTSINSLQFNPTEVWYDYFSQEGIILRTIDAVWNIRTIENPDGTGRAKFHERLELISKN